MAEPRLTDFDVEPDPEAKLANDPLPNEPRTELGCAHRFVEVAGNHVRYVPVWKRWLVWDGARWAEDLTRKHHRWMTVLARTITNETLLIQDDKQRALAEREALHLERSSSVSGALALASSHARIVVDHRQLDADPFLLNCRNGTLDLRTGELRRHEPADLLTKLAGAAYRPEANGNQFQRFLARIQPDEKDRRFLARLLGLTLEGRQVEHVLPILHGEGANGKGTFLETVSVALGDYAAAAAPNLLTAKRFDQHPTDVADLFGLRLAVLQETDKNRRLAEGTVKRLTGGDRVKARKMHQDFWEFEPSHNFVMATNHRPLVQGTDEGIWRRLRLVPFNVVVPEKERDKDLPSRLALEADAVLAWLVAGYEDWKADGLQEPESVLAATERYRNESDVLGRFLNECTEQVLGDGSGSTELFQAWEQWCSLNGERAGSQTAFSGDLVDRGYEKKHGRSGKVWQNLKLTPEGQL